MLSLGNRMADCIALTAIKRWKITVFRQIPCRRNSGRTPPGCQSSFRKISQSTCRRLPVLTLCWASDKSAHFAHILTSSSHQLNFDHCLARSCQHCMNVSITSCCGKRRNLLIPEYWEQLKHFRKTGNLLGSATWTGHTSLVKLCSVAGCCSMEIPHHWLLWQPLELQLW